MGLGWGEKNGMFRYGIVCWQQIELGGLDRGWEGMGSNGRIVVGV